MSFLPSRQTSLPAPAPARTRHASSGRGRLGAGTAPAMAVALPLGAPMTRFLTKRAVCLTLRHELRGGRGLRYIPANEPEVL
jgi:hypothetical protein